MQRQEELVRENIQAEVKILNKKHTWIIPYNQRWEKVLASMKESSVMTIRIKDNACRSMFDTISSIHFYSLIQLILSKLNLNSVQPILSLNCPNLQSIRLDSNKLQNIKSLRRINFPKLKQLIIDNNLIVDFSPLIELQAGKYKFLIYISKEVQIYRKPRMKVSYKNPVQNYNTFFKLPQNVHLVMEPLPNCLNPSVIIPLLRQRYSKRLS